MGASAGASAGEVAVVVTGLVGTTLEPGKAGQSGETEQAPQARLVAAVIIGGCRLGRRCRRRGRFDDGGRAKREDAHEGGDGVPLLHADSFVLRMLRDATS